MEDEVNLIADEAGLTDEQRYAVYSTLQKVLTKIVQNTADEKVRRLKKQSLEDKLHKSPAAISVLRRIGFVDDGTTYVLPSNVDISPLFEAVEILEGITESIGEPPASQAPPPSSNAASCASSASASCCASAAAPSAAPRAARSDAEKQRVGAASQLQDIRSAHAAQFVEGGSAAAALRATAPQATTAAAAATSPSPVHTTSSSSLPSSEKKAAKSAFDFENRQKREQKEKAATESLEELRRAQRQKYQEFAADPNARNNAIYHQPASIAPGGQAEQGWGDWFGSFFGGGSSSSSGSKPAPREDKPKPRMKTINDLPKPPKRG